jgi:hypothetical protein
MSWPCSALRLDRTGLVGRIAIVCRGIRVPAALVALLLARGAFADSERDRAAAQGLQAEGLKLLEAGAAAAALQKFSAAYALVPSPKVVFNMGRAHAELGQGPEAYRCFDQFLAEATTNVPPESRAEAELMRSQLRSRLALVEVVGPPGAVLSVDGHQLATLPLPRALAVEPGMRALRVEADGQPVIDKRLELTPGSTLRLVVEVAPRPPPPPPPTATTLVAPAVAPLAERPSPLRRWWFWTAAGVVVAAAAVGVAAALGGFSRGGECPPGFRCM